MSHCHHCHNHHHHHHNGEIFGKHEKLLCARLILCIIVLVSIWIFQIPPALLLIFYIVAYVIAGVDVLWRALRNIVHGEIFDENFLMTLATLCAFAIGEYPEAVSVMLFYQIGEMFQEIAVSRSKRSIASLMDIRPDYANLVTNAGINKVTPEVVNVGDIIEVRPGEKVPLDGIVVEGISTIDSSALTGESLPIDVESGDKVLSGVINLTGLMRIKTISSFKESTISQILNVVENAESGKSKSERFITKFANIYTPIVCVLALLLGTIPPLCLGQEWAVWINRALIFLVISCPCALVISIPLTFFAGVGGASRNGILFKGASYIELLSKIKTIIFDKTGTLTHGSFSVSEIHPINCNAQALLTLAARVESYSDHPIAVSLRKAANKGAEDIGVNNVNYIIGEGVEAHVDGDKVYVGNLKMMQRIGNNVPDVSKRGSVIYVVRNCEYSGYIVISDTIKETSRDAVSILHKAGISNIIILSGDRESEVKSVAKYLNIDKVEAQLLPTDKVDKVKSIIKSQKEGETLAFVGDGINDAPVLKIADIGISMGVIASDAAIEAADVIIMDDDPIKVPLAIQSAKSTMRIVWQNIFIAIGIKVLVMLLGAFGIVDLWLAVFADVGVMIITVLNALRACAKVKAIH